MLPGNRGSGPASVPLASPATTAPGRPAGLTVAGPERGDQTRIVDSMVTWRAG